MKSTRWSKSQATVDRVSYVFFVKIQNAIFKTNLDWRVVWCCWIHFSLSSPSLANLSSPFWMQNMSTLGQLFWPIPFTNEITTTYLSAGHIKSEAAGWKSGRLHCSLPRSYKSSSRSRHCWLRNNIYFPFASLRGNIPISQNDPYQTNSNTRTQPDPKLKNPTLRPCRQGGLAHFYTWTVKFEFWYHLLKNQIKPNFQKKSSGVWFILKHICQCREHFS